MTKPLVQPVDMPWSEFPKSSASSKGMRPLAVSCDNVPCEYKPDIVYQMRGGTALHLQVILPLEEYCPAGGLTLVMLIPG